MLRPCGSHCLTLHGMSADLRESAPHLPRGETRTKHARDLVARCSESDASTTDSTAQWTQPDNAGPPHYFRVFPPSHPRLTTLPADLISPPSLSPMSLRREQAELQRALELSSQQAAAFAHISPYTLSSATTADSRDLELRPAAPLAAPAQCESHTTLPSDGVAQPLLKCLAKGAHGMLCGVIFLIDTCYRNAEHCHRPREGCLQRAHVLDDVLPLGPAKTLRQRATPYLCSRREPEPWLRLVITPILPTSDHPRDAVRSLVRLSADCIAASNSMSSTSMSFSGPATPIRPQESSLLSPDSPRRRLPRQSLVEVVVPRSRRETSRDPIDFLDTQDCVIVGGSTAPILPPPPPLPPSSIELFPASGSSATSANGRRSARVLKKQEDEAAAAAERKRKRAERKAREAAEKAELQRRIDAGEIEPPEDPKKKRRRTTESRAKKNSKTSQSSDSQASHRLSSQSELAERPVPVTSSSSSAHPTATDASAGSTSPIRPTPNPAETIAEPRPSTESRRAPSPTKRVETPQAAPSSPAQPTTPGPATSSSSSSAAPAPTTPAARPLQPSRSTPASSDRPSTPGPNGYKWKTGMSKATLPLFQLTFSPKRPGKRAEQVPESSADRHVEALEDSVVAYEHRAGKGRTAASPTQAKAKGGE